MVILMISVGIVMSVAFGSSSSPSSSSSTNTINNINDDLLNTTRIGGNNSASSASPLFQVVPIGSLGSVTGAADGLQGGPVLYHTDTEQWNNWKHERRKKFKRVKQALLEHNH
jgi:hypothetical protein